VLAGVTSLKCASEHRPDSASPVGALGFKF
jgi:hypothetical protein